MLTLAANDVICNPSGCCPFIYQPISMLRLCCLPGPGPVPWTPTLAAVFLVAVVHAVEDLVAAPTPRDAVGPVQTQELVLPALLHAADLAGQEAADVRASRPSKGVLMNGGVGGVGGGGTDLVRAVEAVVVAVAPQAGGDAASAGTHVLVEGTCGEN